MLRPRAPIAACSLLILGAAVLPALEPPTTEQLERYRLDGSLAARTEAARQIGNHLPAPQVAARLRPDAATKALPDASGLLPSQGSPRVLALLIAFSDMPGHTDPAVVDDMLFGDGDPALFPAESLAAFYRRSSYGRLDIGGSTLGWYTTPYPRDSVSQSTSGREALIREVVSHWDDEGHDFAQYDNDGDGAVDYFIVIWTGEHGEWADFWWGYQTRFRDSGFTVDGVRLGTYSWQWESYDWPGRFSPDVVIHETGHALGLPDYYDYDDAVGPRGGVGGLDQMAGNWGDHNAFSKWLLGWLEPEVYNQDAHQLLLAPSDTVPQAAVLMHGDPVADPYTEYFVVQHRRRQGNDLEIPADGLLIWHVDARIDDSGRFLYDNSYTEHKLLRLMEADGLEEIELGGRADGGDFYTPGDAFDTVSLPSSHRYDGVPTNLAVGDIVLAGDDVGLEADLGSGCAIWCDAAVGSTGWPGLPVDFEGSLATANCQASPAYEWLFGDGGSSGEAGASHVYVAAGSFQWRVTAGLGDAVCSHQGSILVCTDFPCWQWRALSPMARGRSGHAAVELADGRILVVGGTGGAPEIYDPAADAWSETGPTRGRYQWARAGLLGDGRVLVVGSGSPEHVDTEIYDPAGNAWSVTGQLNHDRIAHGGLRLPDGRFLVAGGVFEIEGDFEHVHEVEVYDPHTAVWTVVGTIQQEMVLPGMALLADGRALVVGGRRATFFDPGTDRLSHAALLPAEWSSPLVATLGDGRVLMVGPESSTLTLIWDPATGGWELAGNLDTFRSGAAATTLPNGLVLVTGGHYGADLSSSVFFDPATSTWTTASSLTIPRSFHSATLTRDGRLLLIGGASDEPGSASATASAELLARPASPPRRPGGRSTP
ncbi:MAG TPA: M6 family metalloprotease domain-containing protein [Methylomirabilota bacterium]|nr:M6 family metalloprotease domain-containing protein [Methylomirabilota bacterium]